MKVPDYILYLPLVLAERYSQDQADRSTGQEDFMEAFAKELRPFKMAKYKPMKKSPYYFRAVTASEWTGTTPLTLL